MTRFFHTPPDLQSVLLALLSAAAIAAIVATIGARLLRALVRQWLGPDHVTLRSPIVRGPIRLIRITLFVLVWIALTPPALELFGEHPKRGLHLGQLSSWALAGGLRLVFIAALAFVLLRLVSVLVARFEAEVGSGGEHDVLERVKRARTLGGLIRNVLSALIVLIAGTMILREVGVEITPILTGAGILGLAVGFGAQTLVKDVISGFFMILEDDVRIGDHVAIGAHAGIVEEMKLRTIVLRDTEGAVHIIPNGSVAAISNRTKDYAYAVIDVPAAYRSDTDRVAAILASVGKDLRTSDQFGPHVLDDLEVLGIDAFTDTSVTIKARIKTVPLRQWDIGRELRRRVKRALDEAGVALAHRPEPERPEPEKQESDRLEPPANPQ